MKRYLLMGLAGAAAATGAGVGALWYYLSDSMNHEYNPGWPNSG